MDQTPIGARLRALRDAAGLTLREVGEKAGVAPSYLSTLERDGSSPTLAMLHNILAALGTDLLDFFAEEPPPAAGRVFRREHMHSAADPSRRYTFLLPRRADIPVEVLDEFLLPGEVAPAYECHASAMVGTVLAGVLELEVEGEDVEWLRPGDAFHVPAGTPHRGRCTSSEPVHLITVFVPPKY